MKKVSDTMTMQERLRELGGDIGPEAADYIDELEHDLEESRNEQKLYELLKAIQTVSEAQFADTVLEPESESWRTAWAKRALELEGVNEKLIEVLHKCTLHLEQEAEAECVEDRWQANDAMLLCSEIDELFASQPLPPANADVYRKER